MLVGKLTEDNVELEKECESSFDSVKSLEQPSPVSILDHAISSPTNPLSKSMTGMFIYGVLLKFLFYKVIW